MGGHPEYLESKTIRALDDGADCKVSCGACPLFAIPSDPTTAIYDPLVVTYNSL